MNRFLSVVCLLSLTGCGIDAPAPRESSSVVFAIEPAPARDPLRLGWIATHTSGGKVARFRIDLEPEARGAKLPTFVRCRLSREPGSDGSVLLARLAKSLGGSVPPVAPGLEAVDAPTVILGRNLSRGGGGDRIAGLFGTEPAGSWISTKMTFEDAEVFLNLDPVGGYGEFSLKDPTYGSGLLRVFGRLLQGEATGGVADLTAAGDGASAPEAREPRAATPEATPDRDAARVATLAARARAGNPPTDRARALEDLAKMGASAAGAADVFAEALGDPEEMIRNTALRNFAKIRPDDALALEAVKPLLNDPSMVNQVLAAGALADFGEPDLAVAELKKHLGGKEATWAAVALSRMGLHAAPATAGLIIMLETRKDASVGYAACQALAAIGRPASPALPALRKAAADPDRSVSGMADYAIRQIEGR